MADQVSCVNVSDVGRLRASVAGVHPAMAVEIGRRTILTAERPSFEQLDWTNVGLVIQWAFKSSIKGVAEAIVFMLKTFGTIRPAQRLVEGRLIPWPDVIAASFWIGVVWSGIALVFGYVVLRKRQLAIYSGHG